MLVHQRVRTCSLAPGRLVFGLFAENFLQNDISSETSKHDVTSQVIQGSLPKKIDEHCLSAKKKRRLAVFKWVGIDRSLHWIVGIPNILGSIIHELIIRGLGHTAQMSHQTVATCQFLQFVQVSQGRGNAPSVLGRIVTKLPLPLLGAPVGDVVDENGLQKKPLQIGHARCQILVRTANSCSVNIIEYLDFDGLEVLVLE